MAEFHRRYILHMGGAWIPYEVLWAHKYDLEWIEVHHYMWPTTSELLLYHRTAIFIDIADDIKWAKTCFILSRSLTKLCDNLIFYFCNVATSPLIYFLLCRQNIYWVYPLQVLCLTCKKLFYLLFLRIEISHILSPLISSVFFYPLPSYSWCREPPSPLVLTHYDLVYWQPLIWLFSNTSQIGFPIKSKQCFMRSCSYSRQKNIPSLPVFFGVSVETSPNEVWFYILCLRFVNSIHLHQKYNMIR